MQATRFLKQFVSTLAGDHRVSLIQSSSTEIIQYFLATHMRKVFFCNFPNFHSSLGQQKVNGAELRLVLQKFGEK
jgi:hypothetical protein